MNESYLYSELTGIILKAYFRVYNDLGFGFLEKVYERSLIIELEALGLIVESQKKIDVFYQGHEVGEYYADIVVNEKVILELKAVENLAPEHEVQLVNYLKATGVEVGLLLNFGKKPQYKRKIFSKNYYKKLK